MQAIIVIKLLLFWQPLIKNPHHVNMLTTNRGHLCLYGVPFQPYRWAELFGHTWWHNERSTYFFSEKFSRAIASTTAVLNFKDLHVCLNMILV